MLHIPRSILLVEDNADDIELTVRMLRQVHVSNEVAVVKDGIDALGYLEDCCRRHGSGGPELPVLMLLDLRLPGLDGVEVLRRVRAHPATRDLPVAVLTSDSGEREMVAPVPLGTHAFLQKPLQFGALVEALGRLGLSLLLTQPAVTR